jgi:hypothetical protein
MNLIGVREGGVVNLPDVYPALRSFVLLANSGTAEPF